MLKKYKHISFDLDGTLIHTVPEYRHAVVPQVVNALGGCIDHPHSIDKFWFEAGRDEIIANHFNLTPERFWDLFVRTDLPEMRSAHTRAYGDAEPSLRKLKHACKTISIITGSPDWIAQMEIAKLNGAPHDFYLSLRDSSFSHKPDPGGLIFAMQKLECTSHDTVYIGNSNEDAYFAKNAGVDFIYLERKEHAFDLADYAIATIHSLDELFM